MQYKCDKCNDSGSLNKFGPYYDCTSCDAAEQRVALEKWCSETQQRGPSFDDCWAIHQRALAMAPKKEAPPAAFDAATFIENKAAAYLDENASTDPDDGSTIFHYGSAGSAYYNGLVELAEEMRLAAPAAANGALTDEQIKEVAIDYASHVADDVYDVTKYDCPEDFFNCVRAIVAAAGPDAALVDERQAFEAWSESKWKYDLHPAREGTADTYMEGETETAWMAWEARAALSGAKGNA